MNNTEFDYGRHLEEIQENWMDREEYEHEREGWIIGQQTLSIVQSHGYLVASWKDLKELFKRITNGNEK